MKQRVIYSLLGFVLLSVVVGGIWFWGRQPLSFPQPRLEMASIAIKAAAGHRYSFKVEVARTEAEQEKGLMFRSSLADDEGMAFVNKQPKPMAIWMKNTLIPLDIVFVAWDGRIINIEREAVPMSLDSHFSQEPAWFVLEIKGGLTEKLGIKPGDKVLAPYAWSNP